MSGQPLSSEVAEQTEFQTADVPKQLRILVVAAQPLSAAVLDVDEEEALVRNAFRELTESGRVTIDPLANASPGRLHERLEGGRYDVVHL